MTSPFLYLPVIQRISLYCLHDQEHGSAQLISHPVYFIEHFGRRHWLLHGFDRESITDQVIHIGLDGSVVLDHILGQEGGAAAPLHLIMIDWPIQAFALVVYNPILFFAGGKDRMLDR